MIEDLNSLIAKAEKGELKPIENDGAGQKLEKESWFDDTMFLKHSLNGEKCFEASSSLKENLDNKSNK